MMLGRGLLLPATYTLLTKTFWMIIQLKHNFYCKIYYWKLMWVEHYEVYLCLVLLGLSVVRGQTLSWRQWS